MAYEAMPGRGCRQSSDGSAASCDLHKPTDHDTNNTNLSLLLLLLFFFCCATIMSVCHSLAQRLAGIDGGGGGAILDCTQSCPDCHVVVLGFDK